MAEKICLKEAFRYQNFFESLLERILNDYLRTSNVLTVETEHKFNEVNKEKDNVTENETAERPFDCKVDDLFDLCLEIIDLKATLSQKIAIAKNKAKINIDTAALINKNKQELAMHLNHLSSLKSSEEKSFGVDYKFDVDMKQQSYRYPTKTVKSIDFNRNTALAIAKRLLKEADETSTKIEEVQILTKFEFDTPYNVNDTLEDVVAKFMEKKEK